MTQTPENEGLTTAAVPTAKKPWWRRVPLYLRIVVALVLGVLAGLLLPASFAEDLDIPAQIILRLLGAIAPPLILLAVMRALIGAAVRGRLAGKMVFLLVLNTTVAILLGLLVANVIRPGSHASLPPGEPPKVSGNMLMQLLDNEGKRILWIRLLRRIGDAG